MLDNLGLIEKLGTIIEPIVKDLNYELYHLEYVKEHGENYLRIYIDKNNGISLDDCEKVSRKVSEALDVEDPITDAYYLEVSSPGLDRVLHTDKHLERYTGSNVEIKLNKLFQGKKKIEGNLKSFDNEYIVINYSEEELSIPRIIISNITLKGEI